MGHRDNVQAKLDEILTAGRDVPPATAEMVLALADSLDGPTPAAPASTASKKSAKADPAPADADAIAATQPAEAPAQPE